MWLFLLTVSLLCWGSDGISCKNENGVEVDWYILYKKPKGLKYISIESTTKKVKEMDEDINDYKGFLAQTLQPLFQNPMPKDIGFISYSDQPLKDGKRISVSDKYGHSKGVVMVDKNADSGFWLLHSKPGFPAEKDQNKFWYTGKGNPEDHKKYEKAQTFICVTFNYEAFKTIGEHLQEIRAYSFDSQIPNNYHKELQDAKNHAHKEPSECFHQLESKNLQKKFHSVAKNQGKTVRDGDLYVKISKLIKGDVFVQSWGCSQDTLNYCDETYKVVNIATVHNVLDTSKWVATIDHSKWCVAKDKDWTCIADVNRASKQYERYGGALCIEDKEIKELFLKFKGTVKVCTHKHKRTNGKNDNDNDPDCEDELHDLKFDTDTDTDLSSKRKRPEEKKGPPKKVQKLTLKHDI